MAIGKNKKINSDNIYELFASPFFALGILCLVIMFFLIEFYEDQWFLIAVGRDIVQNGIPHVNNLTWLKDLEIVVQQWLYDVVFFALYELFGDYSGIILGVINSVLVFLPMYKTARLKNDQGKSFFIICLLILCTTEIIGPRPTFLSVGLLLWQIYICEANRSMWWIPLLVLLEANLHSSYIIFHFVYLLPYIVPGVTKHLEDNHNLKYIRIIPAMIIAALCNPYGLKGALYLFYSYSDVMKLEIGELKTFFKYPYIVNLHFSIPILICIVITIMVAVKFKEKLPSSEFYAYIGTMALLILFPAFKNILFITIGFLPIASIIFKELSIKKYSFSGMMLAVILLIVVMANEIPKIMSYHQNKYPSKIIEYLQEAKPERLFTTRATGASMELAGIRCFVDGRPELFLKKINGKSDYFFDEIKMVQGTKKEKDAVSKKYNFDYFLFDERSSRYLCKWTDARCELIMVDGGKYLYKAK